MKTKKVIAFGIAVAAVHYLAHWLISGSIPMDTNVLMITLIMFLTGAVIGAAS